MALVMTVTTPVEAQTSLEQVHTRAAQSTALLYCPRADGTTAVGAGWVVDFQGIQLVITNRHVAAGSEACGIQFFNHQIVGGVVIYKSRTVDLSVVLPETRAPVPVLEFQSRNPRRGERVVACGHPGPLRWVTTEGVVGGTQRHQSLETVCGSEEACVVFDAEIEPGNSGGPLLDASGKVIGMVWGVMQGTSLSLAVHARALAAELRRVDALIRQALRRERGRARPPVPMPGASDF